MAVNTFMLDFPINPEIVQFETQLFQFVMNMEKILGNHLIGLRLVRTLLLETGLKKLYYNDCGCIVNASIFKNGRITFDISYYLNGQHERALNYSKVKKMERDIKDQVPGVVCSYPFVPIKRGTFFRYYCSMDYEFLAKYDVDLVLFKIRSSFQKVQVVRSKSYGKMLVLDGLVNITESDLLYIETLMGRGKEDYKNKEILILAGGDGALLYELLKEEPKKVIMLEIDEVVMVACNTHMRSICGDVLEKRLGVNYEIIVGDCLCSLKTFIENGQKFDYVFGDLTGVLASKASEMDDFSKNVLKLSFQVLNPTGKFMTHNRSWKEEETLESPFLKLEPPEVVISQTKAYISSFMEDWIFYQLGFVNET